MIWVALAGPGSNLVQAVLWATLGAIVIGIDEYDDPAIPNLGHCVSDAFRVAHYLRRLGFTAAILHNRSPDINTRTTKENIEWVLNIVLQEQSLKDEAMRKLNPKLPKYRPPVLVVVCGRGGMIAKAEGGRATPFLAPSDVRVTASEPVKLDDVITLEQLCGDEPDRNAVVLVADLYPFVAVPGITSSDGFAVVTGRRSKGGEFKVWYRPRGQGGLLLHYFLQTLEGRGRESKRASTNSLNCLLTKTFDHIGLRTGTNCGDYLIGDLILTDAQIYTKAEMSEQEAAWRRQRRWCALSCITDGEVLHGGLHGLGQLAEFNTGIIKLLRKLNAMVVDRDKDGERQPVPRWFLLRAKSFDVTDVVVATTHKIKDGYPYAMEGAIDAVRAGAGASKGPGQQRRPHAKVSPKTPPSQPGSPLSADGTSPAKGTSPGRKAGRQAFRSRSLQTQSPRTSGGVRRRPFGPAAGSALGSAPAGLALSPGSSPSAASAGVGQQQAEAALQSPATSPERSAPEASDEDPQPVSEALAHGHSGTPLAPTAEPRGEAQGPPSPPQAPEGPPLGVGRAARGRRPKQRKGPRVPPLDPVASLSSQLADLNELPDLPWSPVSAADSKLYRVPRPREEEAPVEEAPGFDEGRPQSGGPREPPEAAGGSPASPPSESPALGIPPDVPHGVCGHGRVQGGFWGVEGGSIAPSLPFHFHRARPPSTSIPYPSPPSGGRGTAGYVEGRANPRLPAAGALRGIWGPRVIFPGCGARPSVLERPGLEPRVGLVVNVTEGLAGK